ncbi:HrgC protein [Helicobacter pylori]|uniref:HrgC protein n=1 Tax=Helicobacter pylori TaxID=210 RepID=UPI0029295996|nr:HrgC protein [Helicobacter pylori]MDU9757314.1 HrgC protein [Helicobacter pylori]MDU9768204.1 HrgC protein [Helicobacter pylori]MDZ5336070.1 HrgC protein [Helicobacter pylori]MDZ5338436.1 HrgC protein [Helicobacter pylori]WQY52961.1 HrgC protein [Helicobacter pylori]
MVATTINLKKDNLIKKGFVGFSWTTLFFGFLVPIIRGDVRWAIVMFISLCCYYFLVGAIIDGMFPDIDKIPDDDLIVIFLVVFLGNIINIVNIIIAFVYNKHYTAKLLEDGYEPTDEYSRGILRSRDMIA